MTATPTITVEPRPSAPDPIPDILKTWSVTKLAGGKLTAEALAIMIADGQQHDPRILDWIADNTKVSKAEFRQAAASRIRRDKIADELGRVPAHAEDFVALYAESQDIECRFNGDMRRTGKPFLLIDGKREFVSEEQYARDFLIHIETNERYYSPINLDGLKRNLRATASRLRLGSGFSAAEIDDAVTLWHEARRAERKIELMCAINCDVTGPNQRAQADVIWRELAERCFDLSEMTAEFVIAALKKFMHQVARKMRGLPVEDHLMLVILGRQGGGKSTFVKRMIAILAEVAAETNFRQIEDDRNIDLWSHYILFLDEMGHAARADMEAIKHAITSSRLTRRPMRSNQSVTFVQNATFIGCANKELEQMIRDTTGIRRFLALHFRDEVDWEFVNAVDWSLLWRSVGAADACPMKPHRAMLQEIQEASCDRGRVETWMANFDPSDRGFAEALNARGRISSHDLYGCFKEYEEFAFPGAYRMSKNEWDHEMKRLRKHSPGAMRFEKHREPKGVHYAWLGEVQASSAPAEIVALRPGYGLRA